MLSFYIIIILLDRILSLCNHNWEKKLWQLSLSDWQAMKNMIWKLKMTLFPLLSNSNYSIELFNVGMITIECKRKGRYLNINNNGLLYLLCKIKSKIQCLFVWWGLQLCQVHVHPNRNHFSLSEKNADLILVWQQAKIYVGYAKLKNKHVWTLIIQANKQINKLGNKVVWGVHIYFRAKASILPIYPYELWYFVKLYCLVFKILSIHFLHKWIGFWYQWIGF